MGEPGPVGGPGEGFWKKEVALVWGFVESIAFGCVSRIRQWSGDYPEVGDGTAGRKEGGQERHYCFLLLKEQPGFFVTAVLTGSHVCHLRIYRLLEGLNPVSPVLGAFSINVC